MKYKAPLTTDQITQMVYDRKYQEKELAALAKQYDRSVPTIRKYLDRATKDPSATVQFTDAWLDSLTVGELDKVAEMVIAARGRRGLYE